MAPKEKTKKLKDDLAEYVDGINHSIRSGMQTTNLLLDTTREPLKTLPVILTKLTEKGKDELADQAINLAKAIERDIVDFSKEIGPLTTQIEKHFSKREGLKPRHVQNYATNGLCISQELLSLTSRLSQTTVALATDFSKIVEIAEKEETTNE